MSVFLRLCLLQTAAAIIMAGPGSIQPVVSTRYDRAIPAMTDAGQGAVNLREMQVNFVFPSGRTAKGALLVVFDSASGHFYWSSDWTNQGIAIPIAANFAGYATVYVTPDGIVVFSVGQYLKILESKEKARNLNDAEARALQLETNRLAEVERTVKNSRLPVRHDLTYAGGDNFLAPRYSAINTGPVKILSISRSQGRWVLVLQARYKVRMTLDEKFRSLCPGCGTVKLE